MADFLFLAMVLVPGAGLVLGDVSVPGAVLALSKVSVLVEVLIRPQAPVGSRHERYKE